MKVRQFRFAKNASSESINISECLIKDGVDMSEKTIQITLTQVKDYQFRVTFSDDIADLYTDEPAPLGQGTGPTPVQLLCAAVGNCLSDSLLFAFRKFKQSPEPIRASITAAVGRNDEGRMRVLSIQADLSLGVSGEKLEHLERVLDQFEDFCTVTQSVGEGIDIRLRVTDVNGVLLKGVEQ